MIRLIFDDLIIPTKCAVTAFVVDDWKDVLDYYPKYFTLVRSAGRVPASIQAYMRGISKVLERVGDGRISDVWLHRMVEHFGMEWMEAYIKKYKTYTDEIKRMEAKR